MSNAQIYRTLEIDLSENQIARVILDENLLKDFLGGLGLGVKVLYDETDPSVDALSPDNVIVFAAGLLSGTTAPTNGRSHVVTKSPLTGILGTGSFGGFWGPRLKKAGFESVVIRGKSDHPVYLLIDDEKVELKDARHLWGKDCWQTQDALQEELGNDISVVSIGPAGENLVKFACPVADYYHAAGRSHAGCIMGSKNLKAITVRGTKEVPIADLIAFKETAKEATTRIIKYPEREERVKEKLGNFAHVSKWVSSGTISSHNFQTTSVDPESDLFLIPESVKNYFSLQKSCFHCPMGFGCDIVAEVKHGPYAGLKIGGINCYISYWTAYCGIKNITAAWKCRELCQRYGMDQGGPIPFSEELYQKGILTQSDCDGLELNWGNETAIIELLRKIAYREGIGNILADGSLRAARMIGKGAESSVMAIRGMEIFGKDSRVAPVFNVLGTMTSHRGADEQSSTSNYPFGFPGWAITKGWSKKEYLHWFIEYLDMPDSVKIAIFGQTPSELILEPDNLDGKAELVKWLGNIVAIINSTGMCLISGNFWPTMGSKIFAKLISTYTGWQIGQEELLLSGERIFNLMRAYTIREGMDKKFDTWPERFYKEPVAEGPKKGSLLSKEKINILLEQYYETRGWNKETGIPNKKKLVELGLDYVAEDLLKRGIPIE